MRVLHKSKGSRLQIFLSISTGRDSNALFECAVKMVEVIKPGFVTDVDYLFVRGFQHFRCFGNSQVFQILRKCFGSQVFKQIAKKRGGEHKHLCNGIDC